MVEKNTSQTQQKTEPKVEEKKADLFGASAVFEKMTEENVARAESFFGEVEKMQAKGVEQAHQAIDEYARLMKESMNYATKLGGEWRKLAVASSKQAVAMFQNPWQV
jgi:hypothetical protein